MSITETFTQKVSLLKLEISSKFDLNKALMTTSKLVNDLGPVGNLGYKSQSIYVTFLFMFNTDIFDMNTRNFTESVTC